MAGPGFPWRRARREPIVLALLAFALLTPVYVVSSQDVSRLCLTRALLDGRATISHCAGKAVDRARYGGRTYSDKAPGMSLLAAPAVAALGLPPATRWSFGRNLRIWLLRVSTSGIAFVLLTFALGRAAEGLVGGSGAFTAVTFAAGTLTAGLAATTFDQVTAAALGFAAFLLAWRGGPAFAGLAAGAAILVEYQAALAVAAVAVYVALGGVRPLARFLAGTAPGVVSLAAYDALVFGSPWHASYRYVANRYAREQASGFFGISFPRSHSVELVLLGDRGLLVASPIVLAAAVGLVFLARCHRREAAVCAAVTVAYLLLEFGYFLPYGGVSPGPRFLIPALPFLWLGVPYAFRAARKTTAVLAVASSLASTALALSWSWGSTVGYRETVWGEIARAAVEAHPRLRRELAGTVLSPLGLTPYAAAFVVLGCVCAALAAAATPARNTAASATPGRPG